MINVTPLAGVWIEIDGMPIFPRLPCVTPLAGVWIEMKDFPSKSQICVVTPLAGVWIEILHLSTVLVGILSLPLRECGLKFRFAQ